MLTENTDNSSSIPRQSPIYHAQRADQYARRDLIRQYEEEHSCRLVVMIDAIVGPGVTMFEELIYDAQPEENLHVILHSAGGDGEVAIRIARAAQSRCKELTVIVPDMAKSAATLLSLGSHHIMMGPASDLGPIDPQLFIGNKWVAAKDIIAAVDDAATKVTESPETYPVHASLLSDITALMLQQARSQLERTSDQLEEALRSNPDRKSQEVAQLKGSLEGPMIKRPATHTALFSADDAIKAGLPVIKADPSDRQWQLIWRMWAKYFALGAKLYSGIYESARVSQIGVYEDSN
jgi:pimeloyl-ACP methyl ester carboxylesterase